MKDVDSVETDIDVNKFREEANLDGNMSQLIVVQIDPDHWAHVVRNALSTSPVWESPNCFLLQSTEMVLDEPYSLQLHGK